MMKRILPFFVMSLFAAPAVGQGPDRSVDLQLFSDNVFHLSEVMLHDVTAPTGASRFYAYSMMGAYEAARAGNQRLPDLKEKFNVNPKLQITAPSKNIDRWFCSMYAMLDVGRQIMPSGSLLKDKQNALVEYYKTKRRFSDRILAQNVKYAEDIARQVVAYAKTDDYNKLSTYSRYRPSKEEGHWYPTPPEYMSAIDPQWSTVRSFFLDSAGQFAPPFPAAFSKDTTSDFFRQVKEVYRVGRNLTSRQQEIANFWDCNPFAVTYSGHMAIGLKKISPGGHWMGITGIACKKANVSPDSAVLIHTLVAMTLHDAFISCWHEKYRSDRIRPEGAINKLMDPSWRPLLQTPPFPEYVSGHSVASASVAEVLTYFLGEHFQFVDTSEVYFGLPERSFNSFREAAQEAAISRLYGGIHFRDACEQGVEQGKRIGKFVIHSVFSPVP